MDTLITETILVFKTDLADGTQLEQLRSVLDTTAGIAEWNVDLEDCDRILRVVSHGAEVEDVTSRLMGMGIACEALED